MSNDIGGDSAHDVCLGDGKGNVSYDGVYDENGISDRHESDKQGDWKTRPNGEVTGNNKEMSDVYEQAYRRAADKIYGNTEGAESAEGADIWDLQFSQNRGYDVRDVRPSGGQGLQTDSARDDKHLRRGNRRESVNTIENEVVFCRYCKIKYIII